MDQYTVVDANRQQIGPLTEAEVRQLLLEGRIQLDSLAWRPGMADWQPLRWFTEFIDVPNPPAALPSASSPAVFNPYAPPGAAPVLPLTEIGVDLNVPSAIRARALADEVLRRDYHLDIFHCLGRGWNLVFSGEFWEVVGVNTLNYLARAAATACYASIVVDGPLAAGRDLYFLKKVRGQQADLNTAFSGFSIAFSQLFLVYLISLLLAGLGFLCCVIPGIYLAVAWVFAKTLVIDQRLDFWDAMECSRRVVSRHWFAMLGLLVISGLVMMMGFLALIVGIFITMPVFYASLMFAYEDIFRPKTGTVQP